jgi:hypothetical protein
MRQHVLRKVPHKADEQAQRIGRSIDAVTRATISSAFTRYKRRLCRVCLDSDCETKSDRCGKGA